MSIPAIDLSAQLENARVVGGKIKEGGEAALTSINDNAKIAAEKIKEGGDIVLTSLKTDFNEFAGDLTNEFSGFELHAQEGETVCQMVWRLWLLIFLGLNAALLIGATIYIFVNGQCMYFLQLIFCVNTPKRIIMILFEEPAIVFLQLPYLIRANIFYYY